MRTTLDRRRNRVYLEGVSPAALFALRARRDGDRDRYWIGRASWPGEAEVARVEALCADMATAQRGYDEALAAIPQDYRERHGALYGGIVRIDAEQIAERAVTDGTLRLGPWELVAQVERRGIGGLLEGRVESRRTLYRARLADGREVYREQSMHGYADDQRESYWLPEDVFLLICQTEIAARGITPEAAREWLTQYRGCVGSELYEVAALRLTF